MTSYKNRVKVWYITVNLGFEICQIWARIRLELGSTIELGQARSKNTEGSGSARARYAKLDIYGLDPPGPPLK